jgi:hypothetical protein
MIMRAGLVALLVVAGGCPANPVAVDHKAVDRAVDLPVLVWKDMRPDRQPWPEARPSEARVDVRVDRTDTVPLGYCADGTPMFQCSTQKPYMCNATKQLQHKCSKCGCPGNEACVTATEACQPVTVVLNPTADALVSSANPTTNYGGQTTFGVAAGQSLSYLDFDVSKVPAKAKIDKATLKLNQTFSFVTASILLHLISDPWGELLITYQNAPPVLPNPQATGQTTGAGSFNTDVTALVQAWVDSPTVLHGLRISATGGLASFSSRESGANGPSLTIIYR